MTLHSWEFDPKRIAFQSARYKFVAKMFAGMNDVLEVGCGDGWGSRIVRQHVNSMSAVDADGKSIEQALLHASDRWRIHFQRHDILDGPIPGFDGVFCLDVFEHIEEEALLLKNLRATARVCIIGIPSLESQAYASPGSLERHVNCKTGEDLRAVCKEHWEHVFMFGMNDETLHTGFLPMSHYLLALCVR